MAEVVDPLKQALHKRKRGLQRLSLMLFVFIGLPLGFYLITQIKAKGGIDNPFSPERKQAEWKKKPSEAAPPRQAVQREARSRSEGGKSGGGNQLVSSQEVKQLKQHNQSSPQRNTEQPAQQARQQKPATKPAAFQPRRQIMIMGADGKPRAPDPAKDGPLVAGNARVGKNIMGRPWFFAELLNQGEKQLEAVVIQVTFQNKQGRLQLTRQVNPLVVGGGILGDQLRPLKVGQVRTFGFSLADLPITWRGKIRMQVQQPRFAP
uniref:Uncharacterized protein n=1 Tax=Magnetococcus massalia (strain MO-1) TaxID=451514 RepID=A0A1S7LML5_MAGMO|nr:Protein of unknown function [Candidatus Magnetococcus massalia]